MTHAVTHRLDQDRSAPSFQCHAPSPPHHFAHGEDVVPVHADGVDAVAHAAAGDPVASVLFQCWRADRVAVVAADVHDGAGARGGDVERGVEVAFRGRAFAEEAGDYPRRQVWVLESLNLQRVGGARCLGYLGGEGRGDGVLLWDIRFLEWGLWGESGQTMWSLELP